MARERRKTILFLGGDAARIAAERFDATAGRMGLGWKGEARDLAAATAEDLAAADRVVSLDEAGHRPALRERFPDQEGRVEFWPADRVERGIADLVARLLGGRPAAEAPPDPEPPKTKPVMVKVGRETKGRRGKGVTIVSELPLDEPALLELAAVLKGRCGSGGTAKEGRIEIQGDHRDKLTAELEKLGYRVKRVGG